MNAKIKYFQRNWYCVCRTLTGLEFFGIFQPIGSDWGHNVHIRSIFSSSWHFNNSTHKTSLRWRKHNFRFILIVFRISSMWIFLNWSRYIYGKYCFEYIYRYIVESIYFKQKEKASNLTKKKIIVPIEWLYIPPTLPYKLKWLDNNHDLRAFLTSVEAM